MQWLSAATKREKFQRSFKTIFGDGLWAIVHSWSGQARGSTQRMYEGLLWAVVCKPVWSAPARQAALKADLPPKGRLWPLIGLRFGIAGGFAGGAGRLNSAMPITSLRAEWNQWSNIPYALPHARDGFRMGNGNIVDLWFTTVCGVRLKIGTGNTGEIVADNIKSPGEQDDYAYNSQSQSARSRTSEI